MSGKTNGTVKIVATTPATWAEYEAAVLVRETAKANYLMSEERVLALRQQIEGPKSTALVHSAKEVRPPAEEGKPLTDTVLIVNDPPGKARAAEDEGSERAKRIKTVMQEVHFRSREPLNELMKLFLKRGEPMSRGDVSSSLKLNPKTASQRLARAVTLGLIKHDGRNNYGLA